MKQLITISILYMQRKTCWIGLTLFTDESNNITYEWTDSTHIDNTFIKYNLCKGYQNVSHNHSIYYAYINKNSSCWNITSNSGLLMAFICGPRMFDTTGYYMLICIYIPTILYFVGIIYGIYTFISLLYNLCILEHNWIIEPTKPIIYSAILLPTIITIECILIFTYFIIIIIGYHNTHIFAPYNFIDKNYPSIYMYSGIIAVIFIILYIILLQCGYTHVCNICKIIL